MKILLLKVGFVLSFMGGLVSCFSIRPVEPPSSTASDWVSPTDYQILLSNLETAINQRNTQNYLRCFNADSLRFVPAASLFNNNESIWQAWSVQDEQTYFDNFVANLSAPSGNSLNLTQTDLQDITSDSLKYVGDYALHINHSDTALTRLFKGQIQLIIKINTFNEWEIARWTDIEIYRDSSWSHLKLKYIQ
ncbi:MAG: hypothetical protein SF052_05275 [Bacteroidia bacterium]|nr:hypothetical protein [Bacteroidia bacterium]